MSILFVTQSIFHNVSTNLRGGRAEARLYIKKKLCLNHDIYWFFQVSYTGSVTPCMRCGFNKDGGLMDTCPLCERTFCETCNFFGLNKKKCYMCKEKGHCICFFCETCKKPICHNHGIASAKFSSFDDKKLDTVWKKLLYCEHCSPFGKNEV